VAVNKKIVVLVGGVGGAKLALGLSHIVPPENLTLIMNTGDDFRHLGLKICPDLDTVMYTLADVINPEFGWGLKDDSITTLNTLEKHYNVEPWFRLGDKDMATHLLRTKMLNEGHTLTEVVAYLSQQIGVKPTMLPMTDDDVPTIVETAEMGELGFQEYFVKHRWQPVLKSIRYDGHETATISESVRSALELADMVLIAPSNPWLSIAPILSISGIRELMISRDIPRVMVTPIIGGAAVKGPTAKIMGELGLEVTAETVARYYGDVITGFVNDNHNDELALDGIKTIQFDTLMIDLDDKMKLAQSILDWIGGWGA
jgi:LPPG:FO 2-phospho-L-lactate transferase